MNYTCPKATLTIVWYNKELSIKKLDSGRPWFFIPYSLNDIVHVLYMKMEYFFFVIVCSVVYLEWWSL